MIRLIGTVLISLGVVTVLLNPYLAEIWIAAIAVGLLSHWVAQD